MASTLRHELARKAVHIGSAVIPVAYAVGLPRPALVTGLGALLAAAALVELARVRSARARAGFTRAFGPLLREHEHGAWSGATWMAASYLVAAVVFPRAVAVAAMLAVALGDASAAVVGRWVAGRRGARPLASGASGKTWAGSVACAVATAAGALWIAELTAAASLAAALAAALAERPRVALDDNLRVALAAGAAAWLVTLAY